MAGSAFAVTPSASAQKNFKPSVAMGETHIRGEEQCGLIGSGPRLLRSGRRWQRVLGPRCGGLRSTRFIREDRQPRHV